jgi:hypothetical protein
MCTAGPGMPLTPANDSTERQDDATRPRRLRNEVAQRREPQSGCWLTLRSFSHFFVVA